MNQKPSSMGITNLESRHLLPWHKVCKCRDPIRCWVYGCSGHHARACTMFCQCSASVPPMHRLHCPAAQAASWSATPQTPPSLLSPITSTSPSPNVTPFPAATNGRTLRRLVFGPMSMLPLSSSCRLSELHFTPGASSSTGPVGLPDARDIHIMSPFPPEPNVGCSEP
jgi:hypothetical protein